MKNNTFTKTKLAASISLLMSASLAIPVVAQENTDNDAVEVIEVKSGIRGSLIKSMDIKRDADGVVDAISAEELGKFPDTNLAESLQRITGVAVSRANGEGSQITVRGFGPQFNLVTLNGRQMASTGFTRSFNFENLSSVGVSALELYKSARADLPTGGLGATVNIVTARPLNSPGKKFTVMAKGIHDTSNVVGDDLTPELAAVFSNTYGDNDQFGFSANISHSLRDFRRQGANIQGWKANAVTEVTDADGNVRTVELVNGASIPDTLDNIIDRRATDTNGDLVKNYRGIDPVTGNIIPSAAYFLPQDLNYSVQDISTKRTNAMATFQFAATDDLIFTLDHVISQATLGLDGYGWGIWNGGFGGNANAAEFDELGTAVFYNSSGDDVSFTRNRDTSEVDSRATSLNIEYNLTESLSLSLDFHNSISETMNGKDAGLGHSALMILGTTAFTDKSFDARGGDIPVFTANWTNGGDEVLPGEIGANLGIFTRSPGESEVSQFDFKGEWILENDFGLNAITFGLGYIEQSLKSSNAVSQPAGYRFNTAVFPDGMFERVDTSMNFLDKFSFAGGMPPAYTYTYSIDEAIARSIAFFNSDNPVGNDFIIDDYLQSSSASITEETTSAFLMSSWEFEVSEYYIDMRLGFRYEETDVVSPGQAQLPIGVVWNGGSEWRTQFADATTVNFTGNYDLFLPMMDVKVEITEDVIGRFSYGKSITRANLGDMLGALSVTGFPVPLARTGSRGNPGLLPFESTNLDFSLEYYYDEGSYASVGLFWKDVDNWIEPSRTSITFDGVENGNTAVHDIYLGQRWNEAEAALIANGEQATFDNIYNTIIANGVGVEGSTVLADPATDPLVEWLVSSPENVGARETNGIEFAIQHLFGETGFGVGFNATIVEGDVEYDRYLLATQAVLDGLGDSANFQVFYEKDGLSVKLTSAWRDEYLIGQGQGQGSSEAPPQFAEEYTQWDLSVNYDIDENVTVFFEGINLTNETERINGRFNTQFLSAAQYGPRYIVGIRYTMD